MSQKSKSKKQFIIIIITTLCIVLGVTTIIILQSRSSITGKGTIVRGSEVYERVVTGDSGSSITIRDNGGKERTIQMGGAFSFNEDCGSIEGKLTSGAKITYNFLPGFKFCAYDGETDVSDIYIRVID